MHTRATAAAALAVALVAGGGALTSASAATPQERAAGVVSTSATGKTERVTVTLLTGDRVTVTTGADGRRSVTIRHAEGREGIAFSKRVDGDHLYVVPTDVMGLIGTKLDKRLFDVAGLADAGYGDRDTLPVLVEQAATGASAKSGGVATLAAPSDWQAAGVQPQRTLKSVGAVAADVGGASGTELLDTLRAQDGDVSTMSAKAADDAPKIEKVWLDGRVEALDAESAPQVGAPEAWDSGFTGKGVKVAVLDTGMDESHPDLDGAVVAKKDFSGSGGIQDVDGHGTHVASTIAGSGVASDGENRGMAPDADLMIGKVLADDGTGSDSDIIAGMEWAAKQGAEVINMSLGSDWKESYGKDPTSKAVNRLTAEYGSLFVVAAGNSGAVDSIGYPAAAASALTIAAVDDADRLADFSSRGPRIDGAVKPELAAPGVDIAAARSGGGAEDPYVEYSGTSMATPHVAGAAAALLQAQPDLRPVQAKAILMGSADPVEGSVFEVGAGRLHIPSATGQEVLAHPASVSFGKVAFPHDGTQSRSVRYRNLSDAAVTLDLTVEATDEAGAPATGVTLKRNTVTVPAGGTASVGVTLDETAGDAGRYSGTILATGADGATVRTPIGWEQGPELFDVTLKGIGRDGRTHQGTTEYSLVKLDDLEGRYNVSDYTENGEDAVHQLPAGTYDLTRFQYHYNAEGDVTQLVSSDIPELTVKGDMTVTLDARKAMPVSIKAPKATKTVGTGVMVERTVDGLPAVSGGIVASGTSKVFLGKTPAATIGEHRVTVEGHLSEPVTGGKAPSYTYNLMFPQTEITTGTFEARAEDLAAVKVTHHKPVSGATLNAEWGGLAEGNLEGLPTPYDAFPTVPGTRTDYLTADGVEWTRDVSYEKGGEPVGMFSSDLTEYAPGSSNTLEIGGSPRTPQADVAQAENAMLIETSGWSDAAGNAEVGSGTSRLVVRQDGEVVADTTEGGAELVVPDAGADYAMTYTGKLPSGVFHTGAAVRGEWTFHAEPGEWSFDEPYERPMLDVRYDVAGIGTTGRAPANTTIDVQVEGADGAATVKFWWSANGGRTWNAAELSDGVARVKAPQGATAISLRAEATDEAGNTVKETAKRAYLVK